MSKKHTPKISSKDEYTPTIITIDNIRDIIKKKFPNMMDHKINRLMSEFKKMDFSDLLPDEIIYPPSNKLPKDLWK